MILQELREEIRTRATDPSGVIATVPQYNRWINLAIKKIARSFNWPFLYKEVTETLVEGTATVILNSDVRALAKVSYTESTGTNTVHLPPISPRLLQESYTDTTNTGPPQAYTDGGFSQSSAGSPPLRVLKVGPTPDQDYTLNVRYIMSPAVLVQETDYPALPDDFDEAIILWALSQVYRMMNDYEAAAATTAAFKDEMDDLIRRFSEWQVEKFDVIRPDSDWISGVPSYGRLSWPT